MMLAPNLVADVLVNLFGAGGAFVVARELWRSDPTGPLSRRIAFALQFIAVLFVTRAWSWVTAGHFSDALADALASATPLVSLIVAEGLLRRHAPSGLKMTLVVAPAVVFCAKLLPLPAIVPIVLLLATVLGGYVSIAILLWSRDTASLTLSENTIIQRILFTLLLLAPLIVTDFRSLWPDIPVRLGAFGALLMLYAGFSVGNTQTSFRDRMRTIAVYATIAVLFAVAYVSTGHAGGGVDQLVRAAAVGVSGLLFAGLYAESQGAYLERTRAVVPLTSSKSTDDFLRLLASHPVLGDARLLPSAALEQADHPAFRALLREQQTLRRAAAPWGRAPTDDGVERALSLMTAHEATHLALVTEAPLRVLSLSVPTAAADARTDSEIDVARVVGELTYRKAGCA